MEAIFGYIHDKFSFTLPDLSKLPSLPGHRDSSSDHADHTDETETDKHWRQRAKALRLSIVTSDLHAMHLRNEFRRRQELRTRRDMLAQF
jgi:hypothetical protein